MQGRAELTSQNWRVEKERRALASGSAFLDERLRPIKAIESNAQAADLSSLAYKHYKKLGKSRANKEGGDRLSWAILSEIVPRLDRWVESGNADAQTYKSLSVFKYLQGDLETSEQLLRDALDQFEDCPASVSLRLIWMRSKEGLPVTEDVKSGFARFDNFPARFNGLAREKLEEREKLCTRSTPMGHLARSNLQTFLPALQTLITLDPKNDEVYRVTGQYCAALSMREEAKMALRAAMQHGARVSDYKALARMLVEDENLEESRRIAKDGLAFAKKQPAYPAQEDDIALLSFYTQSPS